MAYQTGDTILEDHYNDFVNDGGSTPTNSATYTGIAGIIGVGTGDTGWGQTTSGLTTPGIGSSITANEWETFRAKVVLAAAHLNQTITSHATIIAGDSIAILQAIETDLQTITDNRTAIDPTLLQAHASLTNTDTRTATGGIWAGSVVAKNVIFTEVAFTFAGGDEARYFFNTGGEIRITPTHDDPASPNAKETDWNAFVPNGVGTVTIGANSSSRTATGETLTTNGFANGYYDLATGYTVICKISSDNATVDYQSNYIEISAKVSAAHADGLGNNGAVITVKCEFNDGAPDELNTFPSGYTLDEIRVGDLGYSARTVIELWEAKISGEGAGVLTADTWSTGASVAELTSLETDSG